MLLQIHITSFPFKKFLQTIISMYVLIGQFFIYIKKHKFSKLYLFPIFIAIFAIILVFIINFSFPQTSSNIDSYYKINFKKAKENLLKNFKGLKNGPFFSTIFDPRIGDIDSFVISGERGSGKTRIWTELREKIKKSNIYHLIVEPINKESLLLEALEVWAACTKGRSNSTFEQHFEENWSDSDTRDFVTTAMISKIIKEDKDIISNKSLTLDVHDRLIFATIVCLYGLKDNEQNVKEFIYSIFTNELKGKNLSSSEYSCTSMEKESVHKYVKMIDIIDKEIEYKINLLCSLIKYFDKTLNAVLPIPANPNQRSERWFTILHETVGIVLKIPVVIAIDGIDDVSIFGMKRENFVENKNFSKFVNSLLPLINIASGSVTHFKIMVFIPRNTTNLSGIMETPWRSSKLPYINITWNNDKLKLYAEFILKSFHDYQNRSIFSNAMFKLGFWSELTKNINIFLGGELCVDVSDDVRMQSRDEC